MLSRLLTRREQLVLTALAAGLLLGSVTLYATRQPGEAPAMQAAPGAGAEFRFASRPSVEVASVEPSPTPPAPVAAQAPVPAAAPETPATVTVSVRGAVTSPGVFELKAGSRVDEAIGRAGGALDEANLDDINLAAPLIDGTTLTVPRLYDPRDRAARYAQAAPAPNPPEYTLSGWRRQPDAASGAASLPAAVGVAAPKDLPGNELIDLNTATEEQLQSLPGIGPKLAADIVRFRESGAFARVDDIVNVSGIGPKRLEAIRPFVTVK